METSRKRNKIRHTSNPIRWILQYGRRRRKIRRIWIFFKSQHTQKNSNSSSRSNSQYNIWNNIVFYTYVMYRNVCRYLVDAWDGDSDSFLSGVLYGLARFLAMYQGEYSRERLVGRLRTVHPKIIKE